MADNALFLFLTEPGREIEIAYRIWLLRSSQGMVLVDTGPPVQEGQRRGIKGLRDVGEALSAHGVDPASIRTVILTHLHWDHAANADRFPNATFHVQRDEIEFFRSRRREHPSINRFYSHHAVLNDLIASDRAVALDGDCEIVPGIRVLRVGGHTPGSQMVAVDTEEGLVVLTGDAVPLNRNLLDNIPSGIVTDTMQAIDALERVRSLNPVAVYTGHDLEACLRLHAGRFPAETHVPSFEPSRRSTHN